MAAPSWWKAAEPYLGLYRRAVAKYGTQLPPPARAQLLPVALADTYAESGFNARAVSSTGDYGLNQLNLRAQGITAGEALNPAFSVPYAVRLLAANYKACGSWRGALLKYNSGSCAGTAGDQGYAARVLGLAGLSGGGTSGDTTASNLAPLPATHGAAAGAWIAWVRIGLVALAVVLVIAAIARL